MEEVYQFAVIKFDKFSPGTCAGEGSVSIYQELFLPVQAPGLNVTPHGCGAMLVQLTSATPSAPDPNRP